MNKYVFVLAALLTAPALIAECGGECDAGGDLVKKTIKRTLDVEKSCCSSCSGCSKCGKCCCKSPEGEEATDAEATKCNCGKPKPKAEEE